MSRTRSIAARIVGARKGRRALVVAALAALMIAGAAAPAHANIWQVTDNFESDPASRWSGYASAEGGGHLSNNSGWAHSGSRYAYRWVETGYSSVQRTVTITPAQFHNLNYCQAGIYLRAVNTPVVVNFEIINPANWNYISLKQVALNPSQGWTQVSTSTWDPNRVDVVVRVSLLGYGSVSDLRVDDLVMQCQY